MFPKDGNFLYRAALTGNLNDLKIAFNYVHGEDFSVSDHPEMSNPWSASATECSPMMAACWFGNIDCIQYLCRNGRSDDLFIPECTGVTPFLMACSKMTHLHSERSQVVEYFLSEEDFKFPSAAARYRCCHIKDYTPLHFFVDANNLRLVKCIVEKYGAGEDINVCSQDGFFPLLTATMRGNLEMIQYFVENCEPNISVQSLLNFQSPVHDRWSAIHYACDKGHLEIVRFLIESGCSLLIEDVNGLTPLLFTTQLICFTDLELPESCYLNIVKLLLQSGSLFDTSDLKDSRAGNNHPFANAFAKDSVSLIECFFPYLKLDVLRKQFCLFISTFSDSFKVIRWISRKLYVTDVEKLSFFSLLTNQCEFFFHNNIDFLDFFIFGVFDSPPRLLFDTFFKGNALVYEKRFPSWKHEDSNHRINKSVTVETIIRFVELGWFHDLSGNVIVHRVNAYDRFIFDDVYFRKLVTHKISYLLLLQEVFSKRRELIGLPGLPMFPVLPKEVTIIITHFIGCVDISSVKFLKSFSEYKKLEKSLESRLKKLISLFDEFEALNGVRASSPVSFDSRIKTSIKKRLRSQVDDVDVDDDDDNDDDDDDVVVVVKKHDKG